MASIALAGTGSSTTDGATFASGSFTPSAGGLLLALMATRGTLDAGEYLSSDAGKTYSKVTDALYLSTSLGYAFVGDQAADADSQTGTLDVTGDNGAGCAQAILDISGMSKFGALAIRQFKIVENQPNGTTPEVTFDAACLTSNPTIVMVAKADHDDVTPPTGWTEVTGGGITFLTPTTELLVWARDSGFTGTTITAGGPCTNGSCIIAIELDASGAGVEVAPSPAFASAVVIDPSTSHGSIALAPSVRTAVGAVVAPSVIAGSIAVSPIVVSGAGAVIDPSVSIDDAPGSIRPDATTAASSTIAPTVILGSASVTPSVCEAVGETEITVEIGFGRRFAPETPLTGEWTEQSPPSYSPYI